MQKKAVSVYVSIFYSLLYLRDTSYFTLSFELLKYLKFLSSWGQHPQTIALVTQYCFWKPHSKNPGHAPEATPTSSVKVSYL